MSTTTAFDAHASFLKTFTAADAFKDTSILVNKIDWLKNGESTNMVFSFESTGTVYHHMMVCREMLTLLETFGTNNQRVEIDELIELCDAYLRIYGRNKLELAVHTAKNFSNQASPLACKYSVAIMEEYFPELA